MFQLLNCCFPLQFLFVTIMNFVCIFCTPGFFSVNDFGFWPLEHIWFNPVNQQLAYCELFLYFVQV